MDLLESLLRKSPKARIAASEALVHPAFKQIGKTASRKQDSIDEVDDDQILEGNSGIHNLKEFHDK
jgi:serine/threonine protein kinase